MDDSAAAIAIGLVAALPQCVQAAKDCYHLRNCYEDAAEFITSIHDESMVVAASLSQLKSLLQTDAQPRPELHETFDQALTACRVIYACLDEEVHQLADKPDSDARHVFREAAFKDILRQVQPIQSTLNFLIHCFQMESMVELKQMVQTNSPSTEQIARECNKLRELYPQITVPPSIFSQEANPQGLLDAQSILRSASFEFDAEIANSKAYQTAMDQAAQHAERKESPAEVSQDDSVLDIPDQTRDSQGRLSETVSLNIPSLNEEENHVKQDEEPPMEHAELLDSLEQNMLPFMPPSLSSPKSVTRFPTSNRNSAEPTIVDMKEASPPAIIEAPSDSTSNIQPGPVSSVPEVEDEDEKPPPLPPRRPKPPHDAPKETTDSSNPSIREDTSSMLSTPSRLSKASTAPSESPVEDTRDSSVLGRHKTLKTMALQHSTSIDLFESLSFDNKDLIHVASLEDVEMHDTWRTLINEEKTFIGRITSFRKTFYGPVTQKWPVLQKHLETITLANSLEPIHRQFLLGPMKEQVSQTSFSTCDPAIFETWVVKVHKIYQEYAQRLPHAENAIRTTQAMDSAFAPFVRALGLGVLWSGKSWEDFLTLPLLQLNVYCEKLEKLMALAAKLGTASANNDERLLKRSLEVIQRLKLRCQTLVERSEKHEQVQNLYHRIHTLNAEFLSQLNLATPSRSVLFQGDLAIKIGGKGLWRRVQAILLDNYFFWGHVKPPKSWSHPASKKAKIGDLWLLESPIPVSNIQMTIPDTDAQSSKSTVLDELPRGTVLWHMSIGTKGMSKKMHLFGANTPQDRQLWSNQIDGAVMMQTETS
ncbi:hypothetical protein EJ04DRAFT_567850 [Polyplosphaeria fusca]|uniref:DH domain-containing protein n=1 Tax=Polyplosphaeria fusca TaxID=682080 RepID=A0A9P4UXH4_9PLEO|nr:hypothetical protein EJ04DRAFT_567850 [Polyplosphaeria fusca]